MRFYSFFYECYLQEIDPFKKKRFYNLAFANSGLIFYRSDKDRFYLRLGDNLREFSIPTTYSIEQHALISSLLWNTTKNDEFTNTCVELQKINQSFTLMKKKDKFRMIDDYILKNTPSKSTNTESIRIIKAIILIAFAFKLIQPKDVQLSQSTIKSISDIDDLNDLNLSFIYDKIPADLSFSEERPKKLLLSSIINNNNIGNKQQQSTICETTSIEEFE